MPDCFVIMPISTPEPLAYSGDKDHFKHVLDHLFKPAIEKAGFTPIPPSSKGSDLIHADIIRKIEKADMVLCDMSTLNANVFFELGIRTAVDKPVCIVKDDSTPKVPFDTTILNYHEYAGSLAPWILNQQIEDLSTHITDSATGNEGHNPLWKYFGLSTRATLSTGKPNENDKFELLRLQVEGLTRKLDEKAGPRASTGMEGSLIMNQAAALGMQCTSCLVIGDKVILRLKDGFGATSQAFEALSKIVNEMGFHLLIESSDG
jgi:hypothetical protein